MLLAVRLELIQLQIPADAGDVEGPSAAVEIDGLAGACAYRSYQLEVRLQLAADRAELESKALAAGEMDPSVPGLGRQLQLLGQNFRLQIHIAAGAAAVHPLHDD